MKDFFGRPYRPGTFDDPKTKDHLWSDQDDDELRCDCGEPATHYYLGNPICEDCLYEAWQNDLDDCQCSFEDWKWSEEVEPIN